MTEAVDARAIEAALVRVQGWPEIARSPQLSRFLGYIVERSLAGQAGAIKAYSIAVDVFGRAADFDPQSDPIVRVQAQRLRKLLDVYYAGPGAEDAVRILLPTGRYVPEFVANRDVVEATAMPVVVEPVVKRHGARAVWTVAMVALVAVTAVWVVAVLVDRREMAGEVAAQAMVRQPSLTVFEFQDLTGAGRGDAASGLAVELVTDLGLFDDLAVRYGGSSAEPIGDSAVASDMVLTGIARDGADGAQYSVILTDTSSQAIVWSQVIGFAAGESPSVDDVSLALALRLGSPRGPIHAPLRQAIMAGEDFSGRESLHLCTMMFHLYRESRSGASAERANACLAALPETVRQHPVAIAVSASLMGEVGEAGVPVSQERLDAASTMLGRAVDNGAVSAFVWEQRARMLVRQRRFDLARSAYQASLQLNPASGDALAAFSNLMAMQGDVEMAAELGQLAITQTPPPWPNWYFGGPAVANFRAGEFETARDQAMLYASVDGELGSVIAVLAARAIGDGDAVNRYLPQAMDQASFRANGILPQLQKRIFDAVLIADIRKGLMEAGVPAGAINGPY